MKAPWSGQLSAAKTGWLVMLLFFGWLAYLLVPAPKPKPEPTPPPVKRPPSRLVALGLPANPDLEHLPEFFALYADKAEWHNDKAMFAYWNPGSNSYSYCFEVSRANGTYHFKSIPEIAAVEAKSEELSVNGLHWGDNLPKEAPLRFVYMDAVFENVFHGRSNVMHAQSIPTVTLKMDHKEIKPPPPKINLPTLDLDRGKK